MHRRVKQAAVVFVIVFAAAQLVRPERANPPVDVGRTIQAHVGPASALPAVLKRSCGDCHSNETEWRWYTNVAPVSWLMARGVAEGRKAVNFSEWDAYSPEQRHDLLTASCQAAREDKMPGPYARVRPDTKLSQEDIATICAAAHELDARAAGGPR